jgi:death on curing protein
VTDRSWNWVRNDVALAVHDEQIAEHGGLAGIRDMTLVESALARPKHLAVYDKPDAAALAAAYAYGVARNHGFVDGNKRTAFVVAVLFLLDNGFALTASDAEAVRIMLATASGSITEIELAAWFRLHLQLLPG